MPGLLIIEHSSTLANLLQRTLVAGGYSSLSVVNDFGDALERLQTTGDFDAVILGVPQRGARQVKPILEFLRSGERAELPTLVVVHHDYPQLERYCEQRGHCEVIAWRCFSRIPRRLHELLPRRRADGAGDGEPTPRSVRVLFVDDSQSARYAYSQLLENRGFPVDVAESVADARSKAQSGSYDLIIVDYYLPDGTGAELCAQLKSDEATRNATLAMITGSYREAIIKECLEAGAVECMFKNEAKELFVARINSIARSIESQSSVEAERQRLDGILASVGDGVYGVDDEGMITFINPTGVEILGHPSSATLIGRPAQDVVHHEAHDHQAATLGSCYLEGGRLTGFETVFRHRSGRPLPVECTVFPLSIQNRRQGSVVVFRDISERKSVEQLKWEVTHDPVTGLANRRHFSQRLDRALARLREDGGYGALLYIDLDRSGDIVEALGEARAERVLAEVATRLSTRLREDDVIARLEGDRFALLLTGIQLTNVFTIADAFRSLLGETTYAVDDVQREVSGSVGVVIVSRATPSAEYALEHARVACETAKKQGRDRTHIYVAEEDTRTARELEAGWSERFKDALRRDSFVFLAQPIVHMNGDGVDGGSGELLFELLLRMVGQDGQWISPSVFVPLAERVNKAQDIDLWVVRRAARMLEQSDPSGRVCFALNLSNVTLQDPGALKLLREAVERHAAVAPRLIFEITETAELASLHAARKLMNALKKLGCRFALDDFGTGFSSFSHLKHLPVDFIKIDGMFVQSMTSNDVDRTMVNSITSMAHALGLSTIAEHVDTASTLEAARLAGVDFVQGHHIGEPALLDAVQLSSFSTLRKSAS